MITFTVTFSFPIDSNYNLVSFPFFEKPPLVLSIRQTDQKQIWFVSHLGVMFLILSSFLKNFLKCWVLSWKILFKYFITLTYWLPNFIHFSEVLLFMANDFLLCFQDFLWFSLFLTAFDSSFYFSYLEFTELFDYMH